MLSRSPIVSFQEGIDIFTQRILYYSGSAPYIATIRGESGIGKSYFGRSVLEKLWFRKNGTLTKPHDLEREISQKGTLDYVLLEIDQFDNDYEQIIEGKVKNLCGKIPDYRMVVVHQLAPLLNSNLTLPRILSFFDLVIENKEHPNYR